MKRSCLLPTAVMVFSLAGCCDFRRSPDLPLLASRVSGASLCAGATYIRSAGTKVCNTPANEVTALDAAMAPLFDTGAYWRGASEFWR